MMVNGAFDVNELDRFTDALNEAYDIANDLELHGYSNVVVTANNEMISIGFEVRKEEE